MSWEFKVGMKVVCVDAKMNRAPISGEAIPVEGDTYTIREILTVPGTKTPIHIRLVELISVPKHYRHLGFGEACFPARCFRPLVSKPTSIDLIRSIANGGDIVPQGDEHDARKVTAQ